MKAQPRDTKDGKVDWSLLEKAEGSFIDAIDWGNIEPCMKFGYKFKSEDKLVSRNMYLPPNTLRIAEIVKDETGKTFQTISDVLRDSTIKGLMINYEVLVRRKPVNSRIKYDDFFFLALKESESELCILNKIELMENNIKKWQVEVTKKRKNPEFLREQVQKYLDSMSPETREYVKDYFKRKSENSNVISILDTQKAIVE